jgi:hypothetical protein
MTRYQNFFGCLLIAGLLPVSYLAIDPYNAINVSVIDEKKVDPGSGYSQAPAGNDGARIEFGAPVDLYKESIVLSVRRVQGEGALRLILIDQNSLTTVYDAVEPVPVKNFWTQVVITADGFKDVWNIDKSRILALRLTPDKPFSGEVKAVEIKNVALRAVARYNQFKH